MRRRIAFASVLALGLLTFATGASASAKTKTFAHGKMRGIVFAHAANRRFGGSNLTYHNGPVERTNAVYALYWIPSGSTVQTGYQSIIDGFFRNVAADSGKTSNVYYSDTQYYDSTGNIAYSSSFKGEIDDTDAFPANGCSNSYTSVCLTDTQIQTEVAKVIAAQNLPTGNGTEYFVFTPRNVGSCYASGQCSYSYYCAYHSNFLDGSHQVLYANMPYAAYVSSMCGSGQSPNGNDADSTLNVTSHEHNETITDPLGTAWYDAKGNEDGDKCAWKFSTPLGGSAGAEYNQVINGAHYYLQQEWSNRSSGCVLTGT